VNKAASSLAFTFLVLSGCSGRQDTWESSVEITRIPPADKGGPDTLDVIEGRVRGARPGQRIVLYSRAEVWWAQPETRQPFTEINADGTWKSPTHLGTEYAALLVDPGYVPPGSTEALPQIGPGVIAATVVPGDPTRKAAHNLLTFSGYEWLVRAAPSDRGGRSLYDPANAWTDPEGALHLRMAGQAPDWTCAEVSLVRRLGYGTYRFVVRDISQLEPSAVFSVFTHDGGAASESYREMNIEISRWGNPSATNAQYVIQPYYVPANVARFAAPPGPLTHVIRWEPGRATMRTEPGRGPGTRGRAVAEQVFATGVPVPGNERIRMNLYVFRRGAQAPTRPAEVVIETFEYFP
jgi:hypothetical protein